MHFDDRLATVLRHRAAGERAAKTQFRQLLDLLGEHGITPAAGDRFRFGEGEWRALDPGAPDDLPAPGPDASEDGSG